MNAAWVIAWMKSRAVVAALLVLLLFGLLQFLIIPSERFGGLDFSQGYALINNLGVACFVYVPVFGLILSRTAKGMYAPPVLLALRSRRRIACCSLAFSFQQAACYAIGINVASAPAMLAHYQPDPSWLLPIIATMFLQTLFFAVCSTLFWLLFIVTRTTSAPFSAMLVYGLWDYLASNVVGGGIPFAGWALTVVQAPVSWTTAFRSASVFGMVLCMLLLAVVLAVDRMDLLDKREA